MVQNVACVHQALISSGCGYLDFEPELRAIQPDIFVVNEDGNTPDKRKLVESLGIEYVVLQRTPHDGLLPRSTTDLRKIDQLPYRIDLAGGWLDQPFVSKHHPGSVITLSIEPTLEFNERSVAPTIRRLGHQHPPHGHETVGQSLTRGGSPQAGVQALLL